MTNSVGHNPLVRQAGSYRESLLPHQLNWTLRCRSQQSPDPFSFHYSGGSIFRRVFRPLLHLSQSNAVLDGLPINGDRELGRGTGCCLDWTGSAKFGDRMSDGFVEGIRVNLNRVEDSFLIGE
jgi:hypothetical protein